MKKQRQTIEEATILFAGDSGDGSHNRYSDDRSFCNRGE
jgi:hypothetical protein